MQLDISDIPVVNARQMLSILLIHKDADVNNVSTNDVLYSNSFYLNGQDSVTIDVDYYETEIMEYRLIIKDSHAGIDYSQLLTIKVKAYTAQQYAGYQEAGKEEGPKENGYVFAGWFSDKG